MLVVVLAALALTAASTGFALWWKLREPPFPVSDADLAELQLVADRVLAEHRVEVWVMLGRRLAGVLGRGVPVHAVRRHEVDGQFVVGFADGTEIVVRGRRPADVIELAWRVRQGRVLLDHIDTSGPEMGLWFSWKQSGSVHLDAVGVVTHSARRPGDTQGR